MTSRPMLVFFSRVQDITPLSLRRPEGAILQRIDLILRTKILMLNESESLLILPLMIEGGTLSTMMIVTRIQKLTLNVVGIRNARLSLPILPVRLLEIVFSMASQAVQTCLTLKM